VGAGDNLGFYFCEPRFDVGYRKYKFLKDNVHPSPASMVVGVTARVLGRRRDATTKRRALIQEGLVEPCTIQEPAKLHLVGIAEETDCDQQRPCDATPCNRHSRRPPVSTRWPLKDDQSKSYTSTSPTPVVLFTPRTIAV